MPHNKNCAQKSMKHASSKSPFSMKLSNKINQIKTDENGYMRIKTDKCENLRIKTNKTGLNLEITYFIK